MLARLASSSIEVWLELQNVAIAWGATHHAVEPPEALGKGEFCWHAVVAPDAAKVQDQFSGLVAVNATALDQLVAEHCAVLGSFKAVWPERTDAVHGFVVSGDCGEHSGPEQRCIRSEHRVVLNSSLMIAAGAVEALARSLRLAVPKSIAEPERFARATALEALLDHEGEHHPQELAAAFDVWRELFYLTKPRLERGYRGQIEALAKKRHPHLSQAAIKRLVTVVNPNKKGGCPPQS